MGRLANTNLAGTNLDKPDRTMVLARLTSLHKKLKRAVEQKDQGQVMLARHYIDEQLEELHRCPDPAGIADPSEWGNAG